MLPVPLLVAPLMTWVVADADVRLTIISGGAEKMHGNHPGVRFSGALHANGTS
jgi:hypothetical protein